MCYQDTWNLGKVTNTEFREDDPELIQCLYIDGIAQRYGKLPSEILTNANTVDVHIFDVATSWQHHQQTKGEREEPSAEQLAEQFANWRSSHGQN